MMRQTIDYGIDLGTTNSCIALLDNTSAEIIRNNDGDEVTPSAVMVDKNDRLIVGRTAYEKKLIDTENVHSEFKLQMGTDHEVTFSRTGKRMKPEELSAEILKELKASVMQKKGDDLSAAVISVPAAFELPQCEATRKAAELSGLTFSPLVQEPVAAAMAYGFQDDSDKVFWLVYDLGGGTFDAALIQVRDGIIQVVNHGGDIHLGGKLLDWAIVEELLVPAVKAEFNPSDFHRGNRTWQSAFAKLKYRAEEAKIRLSRYATVTVEIDNLYQDDTGAPVNFEHDLKRTDLERLFEPFVARSIDICRKVISEKRLGSGDIEKVILVGGPTLTPYLRKRLEDKKAGLGIPLELSIDPMTVVARGAAIFAGTQKVEVKRAKELEVDEFFVDLEYKPVGPDTEPLIGGRVIARGKKNFGGFTIEFSNDESKPQWRSGKISLEASGVFTTELWAEKGKRNMFKIELFDPEGSKLKISPESMTYTVGQVITDPPLIHSIGVALANNEVEWMFKKGAPLPVSKLEVFRSTISLRKGQSGGLIRIPIVEGDNPRADRNSPIGSLEFHSEGLHRDFPAGGEVELKIKIDESRIVFGEAYIPLLDLSVEFKKELVKEIKDTKKLEEDFQREKDRLSKAKERARNVENEKAQEVLERIEHQEMTDEVERNLVAADVDPDARNKADHRLRDFKIALDELEDELEAPVLRSEVEEQLEWTRGIVAEQGKPQDRREFEVLEKETKQAIDSGDADLIRRKKDELQSLGMRILTEQPAFWVAFLSHLEEQRSHMRDLALADDLFAQAYRARDRGDLTGLQAAVRQLIALLPVEEQISVEAFGSTVIR